MRLGASLYWIIEVKNCTESEVAAGTSENQEEMNRKRHLEDKSFMATQENDKREIFELRKFY